MNRIEVELLHAAPLANVVGAIRQCYESGDKSDSGYESKSMHGLGTPPWKLGEKDKALVERIIKSGHTSTLEHMFYTFHIRGISRLNLQELARHRMASLSVKSTRYTLKELKGEKDFIDAENNGWLLQTNCDRASKYINFVGIPEIDEASVFALEGLRRLICSGQYSNDQVKYALPESYRLDLYWTINARSLRNFLGLRRSNRAHFEIHAMADKTYDAIPNQHLFMYSDIFEA